MFRSKTEIPAENRSVQCNFQCPAKILELSILIERELSLYPHKISTCIQTGPASVPLLSVCSYQLSSGLEVI